jgi:hypothetical protein
MLPTILEFNRRDFSEAYIGALTGQSCVFSSFLQIKEYEGYNSHITFSIWDKFHKQSEKPT